MGISSSSNGNHKLREIAASLRAGNPVSYTTARDLLRWFGQQRRGKWVRSGIRRALRRAGLRTDPDFTTAYLDGPMTFHLLEKRTKALTESEKGGIAEDTGTTEGKDNEASDNDLPSVTSEEDDPVWRVRMLDAANREPVTVKRDEPVAKAMQLMIAHDFSQLPVTQNLRDIDGMISWRSISWARLKGIQTESTRVMEFTEKRYETVTADDELFRAFQKFVDHDAVLVRGDEGKITGIVTATDLSIMFREQSEAFLLLSEIENQLRRLIARGKFTSAELQAARDIQDKNRSVESVADLTFGECVRFLENRDTWKRLKTSLHRKTFREQLIAVRDIRNEVMHFSPDGLSKDQWRQLKALRTLLRRVM